MTNEAFVYVPYWVETALNRNSLPLNACLDYSKLRQILTLEDMSGLLALQDIKSLTREEGSNIAGTLFSMWNNSVTDAQRPEFTQAIVPMSRSTELKIETVKRFEENDYLLGSIGIGLPSDQQAPEPIFYKIVDAGGATSLVVLYKGFQKFISEPDNEYKFVVDQLKIFYVYLKAYQVSHLSVFKKYLRLLAFKTNVNSLIS